VYHFGIRASPVAEDVVVVLELESDAEVVVVLELE
jgi:hypothetical protein